MSHKDLRVGITDYCDANKVLEDTKQRITDMLTVNFGVPIDEAIMELIEKDYDVDWMQRDSYLKGSEYIIPIFGFIQRFGTKPSIIIYIYISFNTYTIEFSSNGGKRWEKKLRKQYEGAVSKIVVNKIIGGSNQ